MHTVEQDNHEAFRMKSVEPFELRFQGLEVQATVEVQTEIAPGEIKKQNIQRKIIHQCEGIFSPNTFTAIVGPSGCGKTTLLNLLSGRLLSTNLKLSGKLSVNNTEVYDINEFGQKIGYVMQQDLLFATFTPRETFNFIANMRLVGASEQEKKQTVEYTILSLGLSKCADTYVGNDLIRGISGGQKKRTSIGVELLINPSIIFLDQPTTGLDSTTALNVITFLNRLAKAGRTIVSTIHQPSSEIFASFDRLFIMVQGNIVYQGGAKNSISYFKKINFPIPPNSNPSDHYMKIMNKQGITMKYMQEKKSYTDDQVKKQFEQRVQYFIGEYKKEYHDINPKITTAIVPNPNQGYLSFFGQFYYIFIRAWSHELRNPLDVRLRIIQMIVQAIVAIILYYQTTTNAFNRIQNVAGCLFFFLLTNGMGGIMANLAAFANQRNIFIRERMNNTYSTSAYFWGRTSALIPFEILMPIIFVCIAYFVCNLNTDVAVFFWCLLTCQLCYWMSSSYGLMISTIIPDLNVAMGMVPVIIVPLMLATSFFTNLNDIPKFFYIIEYISPFNYGFQALIENNYTSDIDCGKGQTCNILTTKYNFPLPFWLNLVLMFAIGLAMRGIAFFFMYKLSNPVRVVLQKVQNAELQMSKPAQVSASPLIKVEDV